MTKVKKHVYRRLFILVCAVLAMIIPSFFVPRECVAEDDSTTVYGTDPLSRARRGLLAPKHRLAVAYKGLDDLKLVRVQGEDITAGLPPTGYDYRMYMPAGGLLPSADRDIYFMTAVAGVAPHAEGTLDRDFYGSLEYKDLPLGVVYTVYFVNNSMGHRGLGDIVVVANLADGSIYGPLSVCGDSLSPRPVYDYSGSGYKLDLDIAAEAHGFDWDADGYTDVVITYPYKPDSDNDHIGIANVYLDGARLFDALKQKDQGRLMKPVPYEASEELYSHDGRHDQKNSLRTAIGDLTGDLLPEVAVYYTAHNNATSSQNPNRLYALQIVPDGTGGARFNKFGVKDSTDTIVATEEGTGKHWWGSDNVGIGIGDVNGDGKKLICAVWAESDELYITAFELTTSGLKMTSVNNHQSKYKRYSINKLNTNFSTIEVALADIDGDNRDELLCLAPKDSYDTLALRVFRWPTNDEDKSKLTEKVYMLSDVATNSGFTWSGMHTWSFIYSMAVGQFEYPTKADSEGNVVALPQIAIAQRLPNGSIQRGIFYEDNKNLKLQAVSVNNDIIHRSDYLRFKAVAVDLNYESMVLGEPTVLYMEDNIRPVAIIQAPPKHWDIISGDFADEDGKKRGKKDSLGNNTVDAFYRLDAWATKFESENQENEITVNTSSSSFEWGQSEKAYIGPGSLFGGKRDPWFSFMRNDVGKQEDESTAEVSFKSLHKITVNAANEDQIYFTKNSYSIWRYPILFPSDMRYTVSGDMKLQNFLQKVVPEAVSSQGFPVSGRDVDWYDPLYDNHNLFTYPREVSGVAGYPPTQKSKAQSDPWYGLNGVPFIEPFREQLIGNPDDATVSIEITDKALNKKISNSVRTASMVEEVNLSISSVMSVAKAPALIDAGVKTTSTQDWMWRTAKIGTTDVSKIKGIKVVWGGASKYQNAGDFSLYDQQFYGGVGAYTQDDGTTVVSYAVDKLYKGDSALWGRKSAYMAHADPGLLLPHRFTFDGKRSAADKAKQIGGTRFTPVGEEGRIDPASRSFPISSDYVMHFRVFNYSFKKSEPITAKLLYHRVSKNSSDMTYDLLGKPDISKAEEIADIEIPAIEGRTYVKIPGQEGREYDNWADIEYKWTTPESPGAGYLFVSLATSGDELSVDNNTGYLMVGFFDPKEHKAVPRSASDRLANDASASDRGSSEILDLEIRSLSVRDSDGNPLDAAGESVLKSGPIDITCEIALVALRETEINGLPLVEVELIADDNVIGMRSLPYLPLNSGCELTFHFNPDAYKPNVFEQLSLRVYSRTPDSGEDESNNEHAISPTSQFGSSSGCDTGIFALLFAPALPTLLLRRRKTVGSAHTRQGG